jgi:Flp pilus assembly protein TadG
LAALAIVPLIGAVGAAIDYSRANAARKDTIILLTDGLNTLDRWYGNGSSTSIAVDARMYDAGNNGAGTCANIKAAGITIYTIQVNTGGDPTSTLLRNCASSSDKFFLLTSANQIITTFQKIGTDLSQLRIAH